MTRASRPPRAAGTSIALKPSSMARRLCRAFDVRRQLAAIELGLHFLRNQFLVGELARAGAPGQCLFIQRDSHVGLTPVAFGRLPEMTRKRIGQIGQRDPPRQFAAHRLGPYQQVEPETVGQRRQARRRPAPAPPPDSRPARRASRTSRAPCRHMTCRAPRRCAGRWGGTSARPRTRTRRRACRGRRCCAGNRVRPWPARPAAGETRPPPPRRWQALRYSSAR